jgi:cytochrome c biogenesis protein CcmG/thiol:disulfide interchange protein DsbE
MPLRTNLLILALILFATTSPAADLHDVTAPSKITTFFPRHAKLRVVNIWATWCVPCVAEMPDLRMINAAFGPELTMVGVSMDDMIPGAKRENVARFLDQHWIGYLNVYYKGNADDLSSYYHFAGEIPVTIAFDASGHEVWRYQGPIKKETTIAELRKLLRRMH